MIYTLYKTFRIFLITLALCMLGYITHFIDGNIVYQADILKEILQDTGVSSGNQDVSLPKINNKQDADEKTNHLIYKFIEILLTLSGIIAVIFIAIGGMEYSVSAGNDDRLNGAKAKIQFAIYGLLAVIFSYAILTNGINFLELSE